MKSDFRSYIKTCRASSQKDTSVKGFWYILEIPMLEATDRSCGWTKGPSTHNEICRWNDDISNSCQWKGETMEEVETGKNKQEEISGNKEKGQ